MREIRPQIHRPWTGLWIRASYVVELGVLVAEGRLGVRPPLRLGLRHRLGLRPRRLLEQLLDLRRSLGLRRSSSRRSLPGPRRVLTLTTHRTVHARARLISHSFPTSIAPLSRTVEGCGAEGQAFLDPQLRT